MEEGLDCGDNLCESEVVQQQYDRQVLVEHEARELEVSRVLRVGVDLREEGADRKGIYDHSCSRVEEDVECVFFGEEEEREDGMGVAGAEVKLLFDEGGETMAANALLSVI